jgi:hypothetical protein
MYRYLLYISLILAYLAISKAISPTEVNVDYIQNEKSFNKIIKGDPVTTILIDVHATGFIFQTFYHKYRLIYGFQGVEEIVVRTSKEFAQKNLDNIGMSLFRRIGGVSEFLPLPPGAEFVGDSQYGYWGVRKSGEIQWKFYRAYRNLPRFLGWKNFRPDQIFYQRVLESKSSGAPFYGLNREFGQHGIITQKSFPHFFTNSRRKRVSLTELFYDYIRENY